MFQPKVRRAAVSAVLVSALALLSVPNAGAEPQGRLNKEKRDVSVRVAIRPHDLLDFLVSLWGKVGIRIDPNGRTHPQADNTDVSVGSSAGTSPEEKR